MATTPIFLLAPAPGMTFVAMPSGATYVADANGLIVVTNGQVADQLALVAAGCTTLEPNAGGVVATETGTAYTVAPGDNGNNLVFSNAAPVTATLPNNLAAGFTVSLYQAGAGQVTAEAATGASVATPNVATTPGPYCALFCIVVANGAGNAAQWAVIAEPSQTGGGLIGAATLASLYTQDTSAHYAQYSVAQIFSDPTSSNNGFWLKIGAGTGAGNWTQQSTITLASLNGAIATETSTQIAVETNFSPLLNDVIFPDEYYYAGGIFDGSGNPLFGLLPNGSSNGLLAVPALATGDDQAWPDDLSNIPGDIAFGDPNSNFLIYLPPYGAYWNWVSGTDSAGRLWTTDPTSTHNIPLPTPRGLVSGFGQPDNNSLVRWRDDATRGTTDTAFAGTGSAPLQYERRFCRGCGLRYQQDRCYADDGAITLEWHDGRRVNDVAAVQPCFHVQRWPDALSAVRR